MKTYEKIREYRDEKKLTQAEVAEKLDISVTAYSKIERGLTELTLLRLYQLAEIFEVDVTELIPKDNTVYIQMNNNNDNNNANIYYECGNEALLKAEIDKLTLVIEHKNETIQAKDFLIQKLEEQIQDLRIMLNKR